MKMRLPKLLEHLQHVNAGLTDGQLLTRFLGGRDEASFTALVRRHGPMVLGVCRRVLHDFHDAEDAFQATFLVLAAKASSVMRQDSVGYWLYTVAYHTALDAARANARRRAREKPMENLPHPPVEAADAVDWRPLLDRELNRLSEKYRKALVLCDLEGLPHKEAARVLGVPAGTVCSRLARARALLAKRLTARGVALSSGVLAALVATETAEAQVPALLASSTARVATLVVTGQLTAASGPAVVLMKGVMQAMLLKKLKLVIGVGMVATALGILGATGGFGDRARAQDGATNYGPVAYQPTTPAANQPASELEKLRRENEDLRATVRVLVREIQTLEDKTGTVHRDVRPGNVTEFHRWTNVAPSSQAPTKEEAPRNATTGTSSGAGTPQFQHKPTTAATTSAPERKPTSAGSAQQQVEAALKQLREARDLEGRQRAADALEKAIQKLRQELGGGNETFERSEHNGYWIEEGRLQRR